MRDWTFENRTIACEFDAHVRGQLPWYDLATEAVTHIGRHYIRRDGTVYDIGASTGNVGRSLQTVIYGRNVEFVAIENSTYMAEYYRAPGKLVIGDAFKYPFKQFDFAVCFLTVMFMDVLKRRDFIGKLFKLCNPGGAIVVLDKEIGSGGYAQTVLQRVTLGMKRDGFVTPHEKELSLAGVQRPIHRGILPKNAVEFFRFGEFAGYLIEKPEVYGK